jgi:hypothetical protein
MGIIDLKHVIGKMPAKGYVLKTDIIDFAPFRTQYLERF